MPAFRNGSAAPQQLMNQRFEQLLTEIEAGQILDVSIGLHWTLVTAQVGESIRSGLATTLTSSGHHHRDWPDVRQPGQLQTLPAAELAALCNAFSPVERSVGLAAINALLPRMPGRWIEINAEELIAQAGADKTVAMVGHFPFTQRLRQRVGALHVLELEPRGDDLPAARAPDIIPRADVLAITSLTLLNRTLPELLALRKKDALVLLMGPSTPMSATLFQWGIDILSGAVVTQREKVRAGLCQGAGFRQLHKMGVRLVSMRG